MRSCRWENHAPEQKLVGWFPRQPFLSQEIQYLTVLCSGWHSCEQLRAVDGVGKKFVFELQQTTPGSFKKHIIEPIIFLYQL